MGVDHIIHAGDIGRPDIVDALRRIAPVTAIRGNVDSGEWARECLDTKLVRLAGKSIYVLHDLKLAGCFTSIPAARDGGVSSCLSRLRRLKSRLRACDRQSTTLEAARARYRGREFTTERRMHKFVPAEQTRARR